MSTRLSIACGALFVLTTLIAGAGSLLLLPRVVMANTEQQQTACRVAGLRCAPPGVMMHQRVLADAGDRSVVNPDPDVLVSRAWIDVSAAPMLLHVPVFKNRVFTLQIMDGAGDRLALFTRRTPMATHDIAIAKQDWSGMPPRDTLLLRSSTDRVLIVLRIAADDEKDAVAVNTLQDEISLKKVP